MINDPRHRHGLDTIAGYSVVLTAWEGNVQNVSRHEVARFEGAQSYGAALDLAHKIRQAVDGRPNYAVIDNVYVCGCRSDWINGTTTLEAHDITLEEEAVA